MQFGADCTPESGKTLGSFGLPDHKQPNPSPGMGSATPFRTPSLGVLLPGQKKNCIFLGFRFLHPVRVPRHSPNGRWGDTKKIWCATDKGHMLQIPPTVQEGKPNTQTMTNFWSDAKHWADNSAPSKTSQDR